MPPSPCKRGCCFTGLQVCAKSRTCDCHPATLTGWLHAPTNEPAGTTTHRDPTANTAIRNITRKEGR